jgi:hypothetical protein
MAHNKITTRDFSVVGLHYRCTNQQILRWSEHLPLHARIEREPSNREDKNAISIYLDDSRVSEDGMKIGYLPRQVAAVFAEPMDGGFVKLESPVLVELDAVHGLGTVTVKVKRRVHRG